MKISTKFFLVWVALAVAAGAFVFVNCSGPTKPTLVDADLPFGTVDQWEAISPTGWQIKKGLAPEDFPFGVAGAIHADCGKKCPSHAHNKVIEHRSGESTLWDSCSGQFASSAGDSTFYECEERCQLVSVEQFAGPKQTLHLTIAFDDRGTNKPVDDLYRWIVTKKLQ